MKLINQIPDCRDGNFRTRFVPKPAISRSTGSHPGSINYEGMSKSTILCEIQIKIIRFCRHDSFRTIFCAKAGQITKYRKRPGEDQLRIYWKL